MQNLIHTFIDPLRDRFAPINHTSSFRSTGQITPEEFQAAGDFLVYKFPSWSWADAANPEKRVPYFPAGKQYLVTRGVPCKRRVKGGDRDFLGDGEGEEQVVRDMLAGSGEDGDDGWLKAGGGGRGGAMSKSAELRVQDVRTVDEDGREEANEEEEIPDMEDEEEDDEEAIIRDTKTSSGSDGLRTYTLYITYTPYYRTPRLYLLGYTASTNTPLPPLAMMDDIVGDYKDKTVTLEDFPFTSPAIKTASVHPCKHASVMKVLLDRADAALKLRVEKLKKGEKTSAQGMEGLVEGIQGVDVSGSQQQQQKFSAPGDSASSGSATTKKDDAEWEVLPDNSKEAADETAIRVDQYLVVFLKFMASVTPGIEHDFTMGV